VVPPAFTAQTGQPLWGVTDPAVLLTAYSSCEGNAPSQVSGEDSRDGTCCRTRLLAPTADSLDGRAAFIPGLVVMFIICRMDDLSSRFH